MCIRDRVEIEATVEATVVAIATIRGTVGTIGNRSMSSSRVLLLIAILVHLKGEGSRLGLDTSNTSSVGLVDVGPDRRCISKLDRLAEALVSNSGSHKGRDSEESLKDNQFS